ncbi:MAG: FtsX-like permease family protein [Candidatus Saccharibacteria bacterium]
MLAISVGLIISMLVARGGVQAKVDEVKATNATQVTVSAAGVRGGFGGGDPLTADQISKVMSTAHVASVVSTLTDQMGTSDTNLTPSLELGSFGKRLQRFDSISAAPTISGDESTPNTNRPAPTPRTTVTGTTDPNSISTDGKNLTLTSGTTIDGSSDSYVALVGSSLATKNNLKVGSTFTAYAQTFTVQGIYTTGNTFQDSGVIMPLKTLQTVTDQASAVITATVTVDSTDNVMSTVSALKIALGDKADITSEAEQAASTVSSLEGISTLATTGVVAAAIAGAAIVLLAMTMIVRERRREIGVIKAIGGTNTKVIVQFVTEALTLTIVGGIVGFAFGVMVSGPITKSLVTSSNSSSTNQDTPGGTTRIRGGAFGPGARQIKNNLSDVTATISSEILASAAGITLLIAIVGSALPAWLIARVRPAEVLRSE